MQFLKLDNMFKRKIWRKKKEKLNTGRKRNRHKKKEIRDRKEIDVTLKKQKNNNKQREENRGAKKCSFLSITKKKNVSFQYVEERNQSNSEA